jgi:anti-anti-sigma factor
MTDDATTPRLSLAYNQDGLYLHVDGRATYVVCPTAREIVSEFLATRPEAMRVVVDLDGCQWVDSTFAGWLIGVRSQLQPRNGKVVISGCNPRCRDTLTKMGLASLFVFDEVSPPADARPVACFTGDKNDRRTLELMIQAHEELAATHPGNADVFRTVVEMLRRQLAKLP